MPIIQRPGWVYPANAGRMVDEVVADAEQIVAEAGGDGRAWLTLLLDALPYPQVLPYHEATVQIRRVVST